MKKYIVSGVLAATLWLLVSILSFLTLDTFNFVRAGLGLYKLIYGDTAVCQIGEWPTQVWLSADFDSFEAHLNAEGWELLTCEQMGAIIPVARGGERDYVGWSVNDYYHKWTWEEPVSHDDDMTAPPVKPILYLYPETITEVDVKLRYDGGLSCVYPEYNDGWHVTAHPDGTLYDESGKEYYCLYWEGSARTWPMDEGFCVSGQDTAAFLEDALAKLGLTRREANEFIIYWLPLMEDNAYNLITFQTDAYTDHARLAISPTPDTLIRVFMTWKPLDTPIDIPPQALTSPVRTGFTVVEWGGGQIEG
jgi:hypothetical protein